MFEFVNKDIRRAPLKDVHRIQQADAILPSVRGNPA